MLCTDDRTVAANGSEARAELPYFEFDRRLFVEVERLRQESSPNLA